MTSRAMTSRRMKRSNGPNVVVAAVVVAVARKRKAPAKKTKPLPKRLRKRWRMRPPFLRMQRKQVAKSPKKRRNVPVVVDVDEVAGSIKSRGGTLAAEPDDMPWGARAFSLVDPDGFQLTISSTE